jgi:hypothetical protein
MPDILVLSPALAEVCAARYQRSLREYARELRSRCHALVGRSREQRAKCRVLSEQSDRALHAVPAKAA